MGKEHYEDLGLDASYLCILEFMQTAGERTLAVDSLPIASFEGTSMAHKASKAFGMASERIHSIVEACSLLTLTAKDSLPLDHLTKPVLICLIYSFLKISFYQFELIWIANLLEV